MARQRDRSPVFGPIEAKKGHSKPKSFISECENQRLSPDIRVGRKLIDENAVGAISTHDLDLATTGDLEKACQTVHFSEQFREVDGKKEMTFDYRMKSGIAETTNALKLLEIVGLGEDDE